jgi:hypothetical protein
MKNIAPSGEVKSNSDVNFSLNGKSHTPAYKPVAYPSTEAVAYAEVSRFFEPEFPEVLPAVFEKLRPHLGTKAWAFYFPGTYSEMAREAFKNMALPFPPLPGTDEALREKAEFKIACHWRYREARERYNSDLVYDPSIEDLRELWARANAETSKYLFNGGNRKSRRDSTLLRYTDLIGAELDEIAEEMRRESPEYKAALEAGRRKREKLEAEREAKNAVWAANQRRRRQRDMDIQSRGKADIGLLCSAAEDYASEFFGQFFVEEYCGWNVQFYSNWNGYWFPEAAGEISELLFSATGTVFLTDGEKRGEKIPEWNYITTYGHFVCGYPVKLVGNVYRFSPNNYRRAVVGFAAWLREEEDKRSGKLIPHGSYEYWTELLIAVTAALFDGNLDANSRGTVRDTRREIYRKIKSTLTDEELSLYPELANEKTFKKFLFGLLEEENNREGGNLREWSLEYFRVTKSVSHNTELFELTFNPGCLPEEREKAEEHCIRLMTSSSLVHTSPEEFILPPEISPEEDLFRDTNAEDEEAQETVD